MHHLFFRILFMAWLAWILLSIGLQSVTVAAAESLDGSAIVFRTKLPGKVRATPEESLDEAKCAAYHDFLGWMKEREWLPEPGLLAGWASRLKGDPVWMPDIRPTMTQLRLQEVRLEDIDGAPILYRVEAEFTITQKKAEAIRTQARRFHTGQAITLTGLVLILPAMILIQKLLFIKADLATFGRHTVALRWLFRGMAVMGLGLAYAIWIVF